MSGGSDKKAEKKKRPPKEVTPTLLREQALRYLDRFAATTHKLKRHLLNKNRRAIEHYGQDVETIEQQIDQLIERFEKQGILDDQLYANGKARSMARQGKSLRQIKGKLYSLGLSEQETSTAEEEIVDSEGYSDQVGAAKLIRRRRFGPYKETPPMAERREKELMALVRNGFDFELSSKLLSIETIDELEDIIFGPPDD
ncbi:regulatory protein RecX [Sneathiella glossodoripedis]|uniref:regulatory protein RecX n=1 Tax=Sneathiella glossodoripedis TaxID=418853 RepID=UPI00047245DA|nr:regulatory protein RecX [Sneathiella glossodoripedis]